MTQNYVIDDEDDTDDEINDDFDYMARFPIKH